MYESVKVGECPGMRLLIKTVMESIKCFLLLFLTYICSFNPGKTRGGNSLHQMVICHLNWRGGEIASTTALNVPDLV